MAAILMSLAKLATLGLLKIKVIWNKGYDVIIFAHDATNKILSRDSNYTVDVVMWPKFGNSTISMGGVIITSILQGFNQKKQFLRGALGSSTRYGLEILHQSGKRVKTKSQKVMGAYSYVVEVTGEKMVGGRFPHPE